jgi:hypothetical protein
VHLLSHQFWENRLQRTVFGLFLLCLLVSKGYPQVGAPPVIVVQPSDQTVPSGATAVFQVVASSATTMTYKWYRNGLRINGATASTYTIPSVQPTHIGAYHVEVKNTSGATDSRNAALLLLAVNGRPVANNDSTNTLEDASVRISVLVNDSDPEGTPLTITGTSTTNGTAVSSGTNVVFTPSANYNGTVVFSYTVSDGTNSSTASVTVTVVPVDDAPVANSDSTNTLQDVSVTINVLANDNDPEGAPLTIIGTSTTNGTAVISGADVVFTPSSNYNGTVVFSYTVSDGSNSSTANVTVIVYAVNNVAPVANDDTHTTPEDVPLTIPASGILANDTDVDGGIFSAVLVNNVSRGSLSFGADGSFTYIPNTNYYGSDTFTYRTSDGRATGNVATVTINITPINDAPLPIDDSANTLEDVSVTIKVLANDSDVEGTRLTITDASTTNGTTVISGTNIVFTPSSNYNGIVVFDYTVSDGTNFSTAAVTVTVLPVYDAAVANNDSFTTPEDVRATLPVLANESHPDRTPLTITGVSAPANGTAFISGTNVVFTPPTNWSGTVGFNYTLFDGSNSSTASVTVTVTPVNDAPVANTEAYTTLEDVPLTIPAPGVLSNDTDIENGALTAVLAANPVHGSVLLRPDGSFTYTPASNYFGRDFFTYRASDGADAGTATPVFINTALTTPLIFVSEGKATNGFEFQLVGPAPAVYTILASTDQKDWTPISTNVALTGVVKFTDTATNGFRFYQGMVGGQATTILEENATGGDKIDIRSGKEGAQSFRHGTSGGPSYTISKIVLRLSRETEAPNTNLNFYIGSGINSGALGGSSVAIDPLSITNTSGGNSFQVYEIVYERPIGPLMAGTTYYLNFDCEAPIARRIYLDAADAYGKGTYYRGGIDDDRDMRFEIWGQ